MPAKKKGPTMRQNQQRKRTMQQIAKGGPQKSGVTKPKPAAPAKPASSPRAITNGSSNTMKQVRAKAVQARRQAQGKSVQGGAKGKATTLPNSARAGKNLIKEGAQRMRTIGDSGQVRAAQAQGKKAAETAQRLRARKAAGVGAASAGARVSAAARAAVPAAVAYETLKARPTAAGTVTAAQSGRAPSRFANARDVAMKKASAIKGSPVVGPAKSFDASFAEARKAGKKEFTWKGKKYNTKTK